MSRYETVLEDVLVHFCDVDVRGRTWIDGIREFMDHDAGRKAQFASQLDDAIEKGTLSPAEYEKLTGEDFDTQDGPRSRASQLLQRERTRS